MTANSFAPWPYFDEADVQAVASVLKSGHVNSWTGKQVTRFEEEFAAFVTSRYAVALANGTVALELALHSLGVGPGDDVVVPARTFVATASSVLRCGARPIFADVDEESQTITVETLRLARTPKTKAVIVVHLSGWPADMDPLMEFAETHGLMVIEDCAQAHGARYRGRSVGSIGHVGTFSFCNDKIISTGGEGGMLVTNDESVWEKAWSFKDHGKNWAKCRESNPLRKFRLLHDSLGTNWRMTEMQAVLGRRGLEKLEAWVQSRIRHARILDEHFRNIRCLRVATPPGDIVHSYYKYYVFTTPDQMPSGWGRDDVLAEMARRGIPCYSGSCSEVYLEKVFSDFGMQPETRLPIAKRLGETSLMFPVHPTLTDENIVAFCTAISELFAEDQ